MVVGGGGNETQVGNGHGWLSEKRWVVVLAEYDPSLLSTSRHDATRTHLSEVGSVALAGGLGSGDLVGTSGTGSSLQGDGLLGGSDLNPRQPLSPSAR